MTRYNNTGKLTAGRNPAWSISYWWNPKSQTTPAPLRAPAPAPAPKPAPVAASGAQTSVNAPMPGNILDVKVKPGDTVKAGDVLLVLEAMKMENEIRAPAAGTVAAVNVAKGATVNAGDVLCVLG